MRRNITDKTSPMASLTGKKSPATKMSYHRSILSNSPSRKYQHSEQKGYELPSIQIHKRFQKPTLGLR
jgi:hypothetical protein